MDCWKIQLENHVKSLEHSKYPRNSSSARTQAALTPVPRQHVLMGRAAPAQDNSPDVPEPPTHEAALKRREACPPGTEAPSPHLSPPILTALALEQMEHLRVFLPIFHSVSPRDTQYN